MHAELERFITHLPERQPNAYKALYPKRITPPGGYLNPKYFTVSLWSQLMVGYEAEMTMLPHITGLVNALAHLEYRVPTYFVRSEFAQAVAQTEPPADFKLSEIKWPLPAMLFVLPTDFAIKQFGYLCPFLSITHAPKGVYPEAMPRAAKMLLDLSARGEMPQGKINALDNKVDRFNVTYPVYTASQVPVDFTGSYPMNMNVCEMDQAPYQDATYMEEAKLGGTYNLDRTSKELPAEGAEEKLFNQKVQNFAVKLMLALTAQPNFITVGTLARAEKIKRGRVAKLELWNPNLIGWDYKAKRTMPQASGDHGSHASPRMHWRRGHMRNQPYGPKPWTETSSKRLLWIEPVLIGAEEES